MVWVSSVSQRLFAERSRRVTAACDAKQSRSGLGILVRKGGLCNMSDDYPSGTLLEQSCGIRSHYRIAEMLDVIKSVIIFVCLCQ